MPNHIIVENIAKLTVEVTVFGRKMKMEITSNLSTGEVVFKQVFHFMSFINPIRKTEYDLDSGYCYCTFSRRIKPGIEEVAVVWDNGSVEHHTYELHPA